MSHIYPQDIISMRDMVKYYTKEGSRRERRLASALAKCLACIEEFWSGSMHMGFRSENSERGFEFAFGRTWEEARDYYVEERDKLYGN